MTTVSALSTIGKDTGFVTIYKICWSLIAILSLHCSQGALCAKSGFKELDIITVCCKIVDFIYLYFLDKEKCMQLLYEFKSPYSGLSTCNDIRWLNGGQVLNFLYVLKKFECSWILSDRNAQNFLMFTGYVN